MGIGQAVFVTVMVGMLAVVGVVVLVDVIRHRPKPDLSDVLAERIAWRIWNPAGRLTLVGDPWPDHDEDYEDCACQSCYSVEITLMEDDEVLSLFLGRVDTPEGHELSDLARRYIR